MRTADRDASRLRGSCGCLMALGLLLGSVTLTPAAPGLNPALSAPSSALPQRKTLGDVAVTIHAEPRTVRVAERLRVTLTAEAATRTQVIFPPISETLGPFSVRQQNTTGPVIIGAQRQQWTQDYLLEANHAGDLIIPSLQVSFEPLASTPDPAPRQLSTDPVTVTVTSVLPDDADVMAPRDIAPPVSLAPRSGAPWPWIAAAILLSLILVGGLWYAYRRLGARTMTPPPARAAHLVALEALDRLQRDPLLRQQHLEAYHVRLSHILRRYIEWRFGLRAPEQTTEEFLTVVLATGGLIAAHRDLLSAFLQHCDLVKFARYQPTPDAVQQAWQSARRFVEQTADAQVVVAVLPSEVDVP